MKKIYFITSLLLLSCLTSFAQLSFQAQQQQMDQLKISGRATGKEKLVNPYYTPAPMRISPPTAPNQTTSACDCWIPRDATWQVAQMNFQGGSGGPGTPPLYRNDDWSTAAITLPFNLCFYGTTVNQVHINNNGNISIGATYATFTANSFPDPAFVMIAPFWADVDTRGANSNVVYYKVTPTYMIVQWEGVGYFPSQDNLLNSFQLIITDGNDPILGVGNNVSFCYQDMQWTTGSASGGTGGFGGTPATVGVNQGNGIDYVQFGLFDQAGGAYDGPFGSNDGIDWLDNQNFIFSFCTSNANLAPVLNTLNVCDTIRICQGQTVTYTANYYAPEMGQVTNISLNPGTMTGISVLSNVPGNTASITFSITGTVPGTNTFTISATDDGSPAATTTNRILVLTYPAPTANASFSPASPVQVNTPVQFTNLSSPGTLLTWNFGDGTPTTSLPNPSHTYTAAGTYTVTLTAMFPNGCSNTFTTSITVQACATSTFTTTNVCQGNPTAITYTGTASPAATFNWNFAGGTVVSGSGAGPYNIQWNTPGVYNVTLTVTDNNCTSSPTTTTAIVYANPVAAISSIPNLCVGANTNVSFTGTAGGTATYNWNFGTATVNSGTGAGPYNVQWNSPGTYNVSLTVTENGCTNTITNNATVFAIPTANFTSTPSACANSPVSVTYSGTGSSGATYNWNFNGATVNSGSGQGPYNISFAAGGNYTVALTVTENGCTSTPVSQAVAITDNPVPSISSTAALCVNAPNTISYSGTSIPAATYTWSFDNGTVASGSGAGPYSVSWANPGNYNVTVTVNQNNCTASTTVPITVNAIPTSNFTVTPAACANNPIAVNYTGTASTSASYNWDFGGGTVGSGTGAGPYQLTYAAGGTYNVTLTVSENGCTGTPVTLSVAITDNPVAAITATPSLCVNDNGTINYSGVAIAGANYSWGFSGGTVASGSGAGPYSVSWSTPGVYNVSVSVDQNGCSSSAIVPVTVNYIPTSDFTVTPAVCIGEPVTVNYTGNGTGSSNYQWNFNGGTVNSGSGSGPYSIQFTNTGNNPISLTVTENGCSSTVTIQSTTINAIPAVEAGTSASVCSGVAVPVGPASAITGATYIWTPSTGVADPNNAITTITPNNTGTTNQQIDYTLTIVDQNGCTNSDMVSITSFPLPVVDFVTPQPQCVENNSFAFAANTNLPAGVSFSWSFSGGSPASSTAQNVNVTYPAPGTYTVTLNADYSGCPAPLFTRQVEVIEMPVSDFIPQVFNGCQPLTVPFSNLSSGNGNSYSWSFFDGTSGDTATNPVHTFVNSGIFSVSLRAVNSFGCASDTILRNVIAVYPEAIAQFTPNPAVANILSPAIQFMNYSTNALTYSWTFGDGDSADIRTPSHSYTDTGNYVVTLIVTSPDGCIDTISGIVRVEDNFAFYVPNAFTPNGDGVNDTFRGFGVALRSYTMSIYNRWGELVFRTNDYNQPWDGTIKDVVQNDVYVYRIEIVDHHDEKHVYLGNVSVIR